jgi:peptidyl-prolyl cis-trans isomerase C
MRLLLVIAFIALAGCTRKSEVAERPVINVDGRELKAAVFADELAGKLRNLDALTAKDPEVLRRAKEELLRDFIISVLSETWAKKHSVFVRAEDLDREILQVRKSYPDDATFQKMLAEQNVSFKSWRSQLSQTLLYRLIRDQLIEKIAPPSDEEKMAYYKTNKDKFNRPEQVHLRQIVMANESDAKLMEEQLRKGKSLASLAEDHSITPEGKRRKGDLGWIERGILDGFDNAFKMRIGSRSSIFKSPFGYHILEVMGRRPAQTKPYEEAKDEIRRQLLANREQAVYTAWLEGQVRNSRVLRDNELIAQIRVETKEK